MVARLWRWFLRAIDLASRIQTAAALGLLGVVGILVVAALDAVFELGSPWGYVLFVCFGLLGYAGFLWVLDKIRRTFPDHLLKLGSLWYGDVPDPDRAGEQRRIVFITVEYTNRAERGVTLRFSLRWWRDELGPHTVSRARGLNPDAILVDPLYVAPDRTESGELAFEAYESWLFDYQDLMRVRVKDRYRVALHVADDVSGTSLEREVGEEGDG